MRPIAPYDLVLTDDGYYALVLAVDSRNPELRLLQSNGLVVHVSAGTVDRLCLREADVVGAPASFAEAFRPPIPLGPISDLSVCPACGAGLVPRGAKLWCDRCRLPVETCCDGGRTGGAVPDTRSIDDEVS